MNALLQDCLYPVMLGSNTLCHACVRQMQKRFGVGSTVLTGKRALTLRFLPAVRVMDASPAVADDIILSMLQDVVGECGYSIPLLVLCDSAYESFVARNRTWLEARFIFRHAEEMVGRENSCEI